jgi:hypothetical protein
VSINYTKCRVVEPGIVLLEAGLLSRNPLTTTYLKTRQTTDSACKKHPTNRAAAKETAAHGEDNSSFKSSKTCLDVT